MKKPACENCNAWLRTNGNAGLCRARPPAPVFLGLGQPAVVFGQNANPVPIIEAHFPTMMAHGWCREWQPEGGTLQ
jgi:hypothetical protein